MKQKNKLFFDLAGSPQRQEKGVVNTSQEPDHTDTRPSIASPASVTLNL